MGMNRGATLPSHSPPDGIATKRHLLFLPELPQVAHSNLSPVALKTSLIGQISCVNP